MTQLEYIFLICFLSFLKSMLENSIKRHFNRLHFLFRVIFLNCIFEKDRLNEIIGFLKKI